MCLSLFGSVSRIFHTCIGHVCDSLSLPCIICFLMKRAHRMGFQIAQSPFGCVVHNVYHFAHLNRWCAYRQACVCARSLAHSILCIEKLIKSLILILLFTLKPRRKSAAIGSILMRVALVCGSCTAHII